MTKAECLAKIREEIAKYERLHSLFVTPTNPLNPIAIEHMDYLYSLESFLSEKPCRKVKVDVKEMPLFKIETYAKS